MGIDGLVKIAALGLFSFAFGMELWCLGMPDNLFLITLGSVTRHIKSVVFLKLTVSSCIAELDLFTFICTTLIFISFSRDSVMLGVQDKGLRLIYMHRLTEIPVEFSVL